MKQLHSTLTPRCTLIQLQLQLRQLQTQNHVRAESLHFSPCSSVQCSTESGRSSSSNAYHSDETPLNLTGTARCGQVRRTEFERQARRQDRGSFKSKTTCGQNPCISVQSRAAVMRDAHLQQKKLHETTQGQPAVDR